MLIDCILQFFRHFFQTHFQTLSPLKFLGRLTSNFMLGILGRDSIKIMESMLMQQFCEQSVKAHGPLVSETAERFIKIDGLPVANIS